MRQLRKRPDSKALLFERIRTSPPKFVHVTGVPYTVETPPSSDAGAADQIWLNLEVPSLGRIRTVINTVSRLCGDAGHDSRVRVGVDRTTWTEKPPTGLLESDGQNYNLLEAASPVEYVEHEQSALAELIAQKAKLAVRAEVWGDLYATDDHLGVRQIHSRRASKSVTKDLVGRDGALKLYYSEQNLSELFLFKFYGQP